MLKSMQHEAGPDTTRWRAQFGLHLSHLSLHLSLHMPDKQGRVIDVIDVIDVFQLLEIHHLW